MELKVMILVGVCITLASSQEKPNIILVFADDVSNKVISLRLHTYVYQDTR